MKKIITLLFLLCSLFSFSDTASGKRIQVRGTSVKELAPSSAKIYFNIVTEGETLEKAAKENADILAKYKTLLKKTNTKYEKIESTDYSTYKNYGWETVTVNKGKKAFQTILTVEVSPFSTDLLKNFMDILIQKGIFTIDRTSNGNYNFNIITEDADSKSSYRKALDDFNDIQKKLVSKGFSSSAVKIGGYENREISLEEPKTIKKEKHIVSHSIEVNTRDMKNLGNIINLAHSLEINSTGTIEYDIDNKQQLEDQLYETAYKEALKKARNILDKTELNLRKPVTITDNSNGVIRPYYSYYNRNYMNGYNPEILKENDSKLIEKAQQNSIIINPQKYTFSKSVYIEFEMN
ncbi:MAG: SIMPL domain-containing protein [Leptotrichiaceae bacterium]|nr:SIMPL domain-containing protein [Leptotrichiaceae bacterium]